MSGSPEQPECRITYHGCSDQGAVFDVEVALNADGLVATWRWGSSRVKTAAQTIRIGHPEDAGQNLIARQDLVGQIPVIPSPQDVSLTRTDVDLLVQAADVIIRKQWGSVSMLQQKLRVGFPRASRLMSQLEEQGVVGPGDGTNVREVRVAEKDLEKKLTALRDGFARGKR
jgi:DNA segregation ATPase FtsK/SpoIIIE-like protein